MSSTLSFLKVLQELLASGASFEDCLVKANENDISEDQAKNIFKSLNRSRQNIDDGA